MRVFGQKRPMKISTDNIAVEDALRGVLSIVSMAQKNFPERSIAANVSPAAVIFKSDDFVRQGIR